MNEKIPKGYKRTEVGIIPEDWKISDIGSFTDLLTGFPFPSAKFSKNGIRLLRGSNIKRGNIDWSEDITRYWPNLTFNLRKYTLKGGDIVIAMDGSLVGKSFAQLSETDLPALLLQRVARLRTDKVDNNYLKQFVCSNIFTKYCELVKTASAIPHISPKDIREFKIPLPPTRAEQTAIATALSDMDALIESLEKLIAKKRNIKQGAMQELLKPKKGWEVKRLGEIFDIFKGKGLSKSKLDNYGKFECILYGELFTTYKEIIKVVKSKTNSDEGVISKYGDILFPGSTTTNGIDLAKCSTVLSTNIRLGGDIIILRKRTNDINSEFIVYFLNIKRKYSIAEKTKGVTIYHLYGKDLIDIEVLYPTYEEQTRIAEILSDMDAEIEKLETKLSKYKMIKTGMMQELLTGKTRIINA